MLYYKEARTTEVHSQHILFYTKLAVCHTNLHNCRLNNNYSMDQSTDRSTNRSMNPKIGIVKKVTDRAG